MARKKSMRLDIPFGGVPRYATFGLPRGTPIPASCNTPHTGLRLFAIAMVDTMHARVFEFADDDRGLAELANLMRSENVIRVIRGERVHIEMASVVEMHIGDRKVQDRMSIMGDT